MPISFNKWRNDRRDVCNLAAGKAAIASIAKPRRRVISIPRTLPSNGDFDKLCRDG